jgi:hypothetical protein
MLIPSFDKTSTRHNPGFGIVSQIMEANAFESCLLTQIRPRCAPALLVLGNIESALALERITFFTCFERSASNR